MEIAPLDINTVLGIAIAYLVLWVWRWIRRAKFWSKIHKDASENYHNPNVPINDPLEAAEQALITAQKPKLRKIANSIAPSNKPKES